MTSEDLLFDGPEAAVARVALAHGAGQPMDSPFLSEIAAGLAARGLRVARFNFPYMADACATGRRRPPDREPVLRAAWLEVVRLLGPERLTIAGKSLGGRIATMVADDAGVHAVVALGYPFHPPGRLDRPRTAHLASIRTPTLICQGTRDPFGNEAEVAGYSLSPAVRLLWLPDGDHSFKPRRASGRTMTDNVRLAVAATAELALSNSPRHGKI